jgi:hypothetical protein
LEERVIQDAEGQIQTARKRDTQNKRRGCPVEYILAFKMVNKAIKKRGYIGY